MTAPDPAPLDAERVEAITAVLYRHALGAFTGTESACVCDHRWRTNHEYRAHIAAELLGALDGAS